MTMTFTQKFNPSLSNLDVIEDAYSKYQQNPSSIDPSWRSYFESLEKGDTSHSEPIVGTVQIDQSAPKDLRIYHLIEAYRTFGHLLAKINPIEIHPIQEPWQLKLETLGFSQHELPLPFPTCGLMEKKTATLREIIDTLKSIYCDKIGIEYMGLQSPEMEKWLQEHIEPSRFKIKLSIEQKQMILQQLNRSELFESFLHTKFTAQKRFSLEGGETLIPMLEAIIETGSQLGLEEFVIGMAHRGRLNVLSNILRKSHSDIFSEFEDNYIPNTFEGSGDVKYHKGFSSTVDMPNGQNVKIFLAPNPSHLEAVDPVVEGQVRARQVLCNDDVRQEKVVPILVHGDAAIAGQGIVYETLQLYKIKGYSTGGTIHIVINNQIGFTAVAQETRSTHYCTDIARAFSAPVFHVNAEDPEGCVYATNLAVELRQKFHCDVFIDLNCYRKYGHNEADEPAYTQPLEYQLIRQKRPIREIYRDALIHQSVVEKHLAEELEAEFTKGLHQALQESKTSFQQSAQTSQNVVPVVKTASINTSIPVVSLKEIAQRLSAIPKDFNIHPKLRNLVQERLSMITTASKPIDWGMAELLAYASLLWDGIHVRLSGQDSRRGTFSHRHAVWMDQKTGEAYFALSHLKNKQGRFEVINSLLSEYAVLGFEFGYSFAYPDALVIWEAQFGDFANGAQVMIDQFITPGEQKWGKKCGVVLLLPHGYEGQGPEHSSGRMERFLSLAGNDNIRVVNPTTPAQFFHLLRKQAINPVRKPLVVFTPKGLLRHPACTSPIGDLTQGGFQEIIGDELPPDQVSRLVFCCGRIYYDLAAEREKAKVEDMAIVRIEQLYPLRVEQLKELIEKYTNLKECFWVQEEPKNMGAWDFIHPELTSLIPKDIVLNYAGRPRSASPAVGSYAKHKMELATILKTVFGNNKGEA